MGPLYRCVFLAFLAAFSAGWLISGCKKQYSVTAVSMPAPTPAPATPTASSTPCNPSSYRTSYGFESGIECWRMDAATSISAILSRSDNQTHNDSAGSLQASVSNGTAGAAAAQFGLTFSSPQDLSYSVLQAWVYVGPGLVAPDGSSYLLLFDRNSGIGIESTRLDLLPGADGNAGQWRCLTLTVGSAHGSNASQVTDIGVVLTNLPAGASGNLYVDDVTVTFLATPTPTPAATCAASFQSVYTFDGSLECWRVNINSQPAVTAFDVAAGLARRGAGSLRAAVSAPSGPASVQLELTYSEPQDLYGSNFLFWVFVDPGLAGCAVQGFVKSGASWRENTGGWTYFPAEKTGQWVPVVFTTCFCGGNAFEVRQIGIQVVNLPSGASGNVYLDDYRIVPYLCSSYSVPSAYGFESSFDCWQVDPASLPAVYGYDLSAVRSHEGVQSLHLSVTEPAAPLDLLAGAKYNYLDFTGKSIGAWIWVDPAFSGANASLFTVSNYANVLNSGGAVALDSSNTGRWLFLSWTPPFDQAGEDSTLVCRAGVRFTGLPASASGDIYIDDVTLP